MCADSRLECLAMKRHSCSRVNERDCPSRSIESLVTVRRRNRDMIDVVDEADSKEDESLPRERGRPARSSWKNAPCQK